MILFRYPELPREVITNNHRGMSSIKEAYIIQMRVGHGIAHTKTYIIGQ